MNTEKDGIINYDISPYAMETLIINLLHKHVKKSITRTNMKIYIKNCRKYAKMGSLKNYLQTLED